MEIGRDILIWCLLQVYPEQFQVIEMDESLSVVANAVRDREMDTRRKLGGVVD